MTNETIHLIFVGARILTRLTGTIILAREVYLGHFNEDLNSFKEQMDQTNNIIAAVPKVTLIAGLCTILLKDADKSAADYPQKKQVAWKEAFNQYEQMFPNASEEIMKRRKNLLIFGIILLITSFAVDGIDLFWEHCHSL